MNFGLSPIYDLKCFLINQSSCIFLSTILSISQYFVIKITFIKIFRFLSSLLTSLLASFWWSFIKSLFCWLYNSSSERNRDLQKIFRAENEGL